MAVKLAMLGGWVSVWNGYPALLDREEQQGLLPHRQGSSKNTVLIPLTQSDPEYLHAQGGN